MGGRLFALVLGSCPLLCRSGRSTDAVSRSPIV